MALTDTEADALQHLMALGVSRDQSLLALVHAAWDKGKAANDCLDHVYTVSARQRPKAKLCTNGCGHFTGGKLMVCCTRCTCRTGPHTQHCKSAQAMRRKQNEGVLEAAGGGAEEPEMEAAAGAQEEQEEPEKP